MLWGPDVANLQTFFKPTTFGWLLKGCFLLEPCSCISSKRPPELHLIDAFFHTLIVFFRRIYADCAELSSEVLSTQQFPWSLSYTCSSYSTPSFSLILSHQKQDYWFSSFQSHIGSWFKYSWSFGSERSSEVCAQTGTAENLVFVVTYSTAMHHLWEIKA